MANPRTIRRNRNKAFENQKGLCFYCLKQMKIQTPQAAADKATADHLLPVSKNGKNVNNIVCACFLCNQKRGVKHWKLFLFQNNFSTSL